MVHTGVKQDRYGNTSVNEVRNGFDYGHATAYYSNQTRNSVFQKYIEVQGNEISENS